MELLVQTFGNKKLVSRVLACLTLSFSLGATISFNYVVGGMSGSGETLGFEVVTPPWQSFALNMISSALLNAVIIQMLVCIGKFCFQTSPSKTNLCPSLEDDLNHIIECIKVTTTTLSYLLAARNRENEAREKRSLQAKLHSLN